MTYKTKKIRLYDLPALFKIAGILKACGDDMYARYQLAHWKNSLIKTFLIVIYTALQREVYAVEDDGGVVIATFQIKRVENGLHFGKLAVSPTASGKGIGSFCLTFMEDEARRRGLTSLNCEVYDKSKYAYDFYINRGFEAVGEVSTLKYKEIVLKKEVI